MPLSGVSSIIGVSDKGTLRKKCPYSELFWSSFFPHFPAFGLNTERYGVSLRIQSKCGKNKDQNNSEYRLFVRSGSCWQSIAKLYKEMIDEIILLILKVQRN